MGRRALARRLTAAALAAVTLFSVAGCVGIPVSGAVRTGGLIDNQLDPEIELVPSDPTPGSSPEEILFDFMEAATGPQEGYAIARKFLTTEFAETWDPDAGVIIRTTNPDPVVSPGPIENTLVYTLASSAQVDADGRFSESPLAAQSLAYSFVQEDGEWRINAAPNGIVLSQGSFDLVFTEQPLYFFDPSYRYLVPDVRWFPSRPTLGLRTVRALLAGPVSWLQGGVVTTAFPAATTVGKPDSGSGVTVEATSATVDLSPEALDASAEERDRMRQQLVATLGTPNVVMTVGGIELPTPDPGPDSAIVRPTVEPAVLVGTGDAFGFDTGDGIVPIEGVSDKVTAAGAVAATLSNDQGAAALLGSDGAVHLATSGDGPPLVLDQRPGLVAPTIDPFRFVWSAQAGSAASLMAFDSQGGEHGLQSALPQDASVVSIDMSRDGTRLLLYLSTPVGPRLVVAGVVRETGNVPIGLGELLDLPIASADAPVDAAWVDDRHVATLSSTGSVTPVTVYEIGGPTTSFGEVGTGVSIVGGNGGDDGLRVLAAGEVWRPQGSGGWVDTGTAASFLATKQ
jgi:hypothetical protein